MLCTVVTIEIRVTITVNIPTSDVSSYSNNLFIKLPVLIRFMLTSFSVPLSHYKRMSLWLLPERFLSNFVLEGSWRCSLNSIVNGQALLQSETHSVTTDVHL